MSTVYLHGGREDAKRIIRTMVATLGGHAGESQIARGVFNAIGLAALSDIHADFVRKARGGVGEDGTRWKRLSPKTLAYSRRFGPGEKSALKKAAGLGRANNQRGLLTAAQNRRWRKVYAMHLARLAARYPLGQAKGIAAGIAWNTLKAEGAKTMLEVYGDRPHEPLRDTGILLNSLSPGQLVGNSYSKPDDQQVFEPIANGVIVGTNVPYARTHNEGDRKRGIPERRFIPRPENIPQQWLGRWLDTGMQAIARAIEYSMQQGAA